MIMIVKDSRQSFRRVTTTKKVASKWRANCRSSGGASYKLAMALGQRPTSCRPTRLL